MTLQDLLSLQSRPLFTSHLKLSLKENQERNRASQNVSEWYRRKETGDHSLNMDKAIVTTNITHSTESEKNESRSLAFLV